MAHIMTSQNYIGSRKRWGRGIKEGREDLSVTDKGQVQLSSVPHSRGTEGPDDWINRGQRMSPLLSISLSSAP